VDMRFGVRRT